MTRFIAFLTALLLGMSLAFSPVASAEAPVIKASPSATQKPGGGRPAGPGTITNRPNIKTGGYYCQETYCVCHHADGCAKLAQAGKCKGELKNCSESACECDWNGK